MALDRRSFLHSTAGVAWAWRYQSAGRSAHLPHRACVFGSFETPRV